METTDPAGEILWDFSFPRPDEYVPLAYVNGDSRVRINELTRKAVVFLGIQDDRGQFAPYGTGFLVGWPTGAPNENFLYLVTAKHVVTDMIATNRPMVVRVNRKDGGSSIGRVGGAEHWYFHRTESRCDIAVTAWIASQDTFDFRHIDMAPGALTPEYIETNDVGAGDHVFMIGLLVSHFGKSINVPIVRVGNIAAMPEEKVDLGEKLGVQEVYLVETRSIGGLSGSPVFLQTPPLRVIKDVTKSMDGHQLEYVMGVNIGMFETKAHGDKLRSETIERREHFLESMSAGISVVVPIQRAMEIIRDTPELVKGREDVMKAREKKVGFIPTSSSPADVADDTPVIVS